MIIFSLYSDLILIEEEEGYLAFFFYAFFSSFGVSSFSGVSKKLVATSTTRLCLPSLSLHSSGLKKPSMVSMVPLAILLKDSAFSFLRHASMFMKADTRLFSSPFFSVRAIASENRATEAVAN